MQIDGTDTDVVNSIEGGCLEKRVIQCLVMECRGNGKMRRCWNE